MARRLKTHTRINLGAVSWGLKSISRWRSLVELGLACLDCQRESTALIAELTGE